MNLRAPLDNTGSSGKGLPVNWGNVLLLVTIGGLLLLYTGTVHAAQVTLAWLRSTDSAVSGYRVYYGTQSRAYSLMVNAGNQTTVTVSSLQEGATYYFAATAYDGTGRESGYSDEVSYTVPGSSCTYTISPSSQSIGATGGRGSVSVTTQTGCTWTASSGASWVTLSSTASGRGSGTVSYTVAANGGSSDRSAGLTVAGRIFTVNQAGSKTKSYTITASAGTGGSIYPAGSVSVTSGGSKTFTISPASRYRVWYLIVDGKYISARTSYTFSNVKKNCSIRALFRK